MHTAKVTTPKALPIKLQQEGTNNGVGESFRVLYYGSASAGSVPFMWESQPGTPKHALMESSLPPLTPPPSYRQKYNSSMQLISHQSSKRSGNFLRTIFLASSQKTNMAAASSFSSSSLSSSSSSSSSSHLQSAKSTPMRKAVLRRMMFGLEDDCICGEQERGGGASPTSTLCLGGGFIKGYRIKKMKKAMMSLVRHGSG